MKTFYYKTNTYEMPEDLTFQKFIERLHKNPYIAVHFLKEDRCMAPYFIKEDIQNVLLKIDEPDRVIECEGFVFEKEEYDRKLREQVKKKCVGCVKYDGNPQNLKGNDIEMTLNGVCLQKREEQSYNFNRGVEVFWKKFSAMEKDLRILVRKGQIETARKKVKEIYDYHVAASGAILFGRNKKKAVFMLSGLNNPMVQCVLDYVIRMAPEQLKARWMFLSYISNEFYQYRPLGSYNASNHAVWVNRKKKQADRPRFEVAFVKEEDIKDYHEANIENYLYICSRMGENLLQNALCDLSFSYREKTSDDISLDDFCKEVFDTYKPYEIAEFLENRNVYSYKFIPDSKAVIRGNEQESFTSCRDLTFKTALYDQNERVDSYLKQLHLICAYLEITLMQNSDEDERRLVIMMKDIVAALENDGLAKMFSYELSDNRLYIDMLVMDTGLCRREIRKRAPELEAFECLYTEIHQDRRRTYQVGYDMNEIEIKDTKLN